MMKKYKPTDNKHEFPEKIIWQQVLAFGVDIVEPKTIKQSQKIDRPIFVVLP